MNRYNAFLPSTVVTRLLFYFGLLALVKAYLYSIKIIQKNHFKIH